jgi:lysophospholipase L1-like esterase
MMNFGSALLFVASLLSSGIVAELFLWLLHPLPDPYWLRKNPHEVFTPYVPSSFAPDGSWTFRAEPGLPGMREEPIRFSVNHLGFRGDHLLMPKPPGEVRIFMVGGSTTECLYLDDADALTRVLQDRLVESGFSSARVYGAAKSGDRSYDHIAMLVHRLVHLEPDLVIVFAGVNDLLAGINGVDYLLLPQNARPTAVRWLTFESLTLWATEFQLPRLVYAALQPRKYRNAVENIAWESNYRKFASLRRALPVAEDPIVPSTDAYARNLTTKAAVAQAHGFELVFKTQATTWNSDIDDEVEKWHWMNAARDVSFSAEWMDDAMEAYNDAMRAVAGAHDVPLFDLAAEIPKSLEFFYDDVHFNIRGAAEAGTLLAEFLVEAVLNLNLQPLASDSLTDRPRFAGGTS